MIYNRYLTNHSEKSYILTLTHTFHPLWSIYLENQGVYGDRYDDLIFRTGTAYLFTDDIQIEGSFERLTRLFFPRPYLRSIEFFGLDHRNNGEY